MAGMSTPRVLVECDRCRRPGWELSVHEATGDVRIDGLPARASGRNGLRPGMEIDVADGAALHRQGFRLRLACTGRKHPRHERVVTMETAGRAYAAAVAAGRGRIRLSDI